MLLTLPYPQIDPVLVHIGPLAIRWYSLAYIAGIAGGSYYVDWLNKKAPSFPKLKAFDDLMVWAIFGIILGGRFGYILFYQPDYYFAHPAEMFKVWEGGMSFHGGLLGAITAIFLFCRTKKIPFLAVTDLCSCAAPLGLFFGRIANFINGELFGRVTDSPLGMVFPRGGDLPRYPSQLFEAGMEGVVLFMLMFIASHRGARHYKGMLSGIFLIGYAFARMSMEQFRQPDAFLGFIFANAITMGQLLSAPMIVLGIFLIYYSRKHRHAV